MANKSNGNKSLRSYVKIVQIKSAEHQIDTPATLCKKQVTTNESAAYIKVTQNSKQFTNVQNEGQQKNKIIGHKTIQQVNRQHIYRKFKTGKVKLTFFFSGAKIQCTEDYKKSSFREKPNFSYYIQEQMIYALINLENIQLNQQNKRRPC